MGFPEMGIGGAALASVCAEISALIFFTGYTIIKLPLKTYMLFYFHKLEGWLMVSILKLAFPTMIQKLLSFGTWMIFLFWSNIWEKDRLPFQALSEVYIC